VDDGTWVISTLSAGKIERTDQWMMGLGQFHPFQQVKEGRLVENYLWAISSLQHVSKES
jgi:hypothetical protein